ncbi:UDP-N-acetylmuramate dehydrogenase [Candidatus Berkelbacteria bacterium]|nr:UDP-N-acetylmuramate dehydrogenase [Candidatus Berkelbacteria bacterium]
MNQLYSKLQQELNDLKVNESLALFSYMKVGGSADYLYTARTTDDLIQALRLARKFNLQWTILGGASNVVISDQGIRGLVIRNLTNNTGFIVDEGRAIVDSGLSLARFIMLAAQHGLAGLEPLYGIPGTVGGALYGNAGAHQTSISDYLATLTVLTEAGEIEQYDKSWLKPEYRDTALKSARARGVKSGPVILSAQFQLTQAKPEVILKRIREFNSWRLEHQPIGEPCCGSVFRNPDPKVKEKTAGFLLDTAGAKQLKNGGAHVSKKHANFVVHDGTATAFQIRTLFDRMRALVQTQHAIALQEEIEYLGDWSLTAKEGSHDAPAELA